jgi:hypothetical protein
MRIMIIAWKWVDERLATLNGNFFQKYTTNPEPIINFEGRYYDKYVVTRKVGEDEWINDDPPAYVIRLRVAKGESGDSVDFIKDLARYFGDKGSQVFVFLHRGEGFTSAEVARILKEPLAARCFLFGGEADFIYFDSQNIGLLGGNGRFFYLPPGKKNVEINVADNPSRQVFQPYFNKVWHYYKHEFYTKALELKEDLLGYLYGIEETYLRQEQWLDHLSKNEPLLLRVKSFINDGCYAVLSPTEEEILKDIERRRQKSLLFDDSKFNLKHADDSQKKEIYETISQTLCELFFSPEGENQNYEVRSTMMSIQNGFQALINQLK